MHYLITIRSTAQAMGIYQGASPEDAIQAMSRDAGYDSLEDEAQSIGKSADELRADLSVEPVRVAHLIGRIADVMVHADRHNGDCLPETLADPEAGDASDWDARSMASTAEDAVGPIGRIIAEQYRERILRTYRTIWAEYVYSDFNGRAGW